eukprot:SM000016S01922  [mRNA]  locus=s16:655693:666147:+ [translate_table: standard]
MVADGTVPPALATVQGHGGLLVVDSKHYQILSHSRNFLDVVKVAAKIDSASLVGMPLLDLFSEEAYAKMQLASVRADDRSSSCRIVAEGESSFLVTVNRAGGYVYLSFEEDTEAAGKKSSRKHDGRTFSTQLPFHQLARVAIDHLQAVPARDVVSLCAVAAQELRNMAGYDRVVIGQVAEIGDTAEVIAESCLKSLPPYKGLHFPMAALPKDWVNGLSKAVPMRLIYGVGAAQVPLAGEKTLLQSLSLVNSPLAGVDDKQAEVLEKLGVKSLLLMPIEIPSRGMPKLWGIVVCHHYRSPWLLPNSRRASCIFLIQALRAHLETAVKAQERAADRQMQAMQTSICDHLTYQVPTSLVVEKPSIIDLIPCEGVAHVQGLSIVKDGCCPTDALILKLTRWVEEKKMMVDGLYTVSSLKAAGFPEADQLLRDSCLCGLAVVAISEDDLALWFRRRMDVVKDWAWTHPAAAGSPLIQAEAYQSSEASSDVWTAAEVNCLKGLRKMADDALKGNSEPIKTMMLVRLNEERLKAMQDLAIVARDLTHMMEIAKTPILSINEHMVLVEWNQRLAQLTGKPKARVVGCHLADVLVPDCVESVIAVVEKVLQGNNQDHLEINLKRVPTNGTLQKGLAGASGKDTSLSMLELQEDLLILMVNMVPQWDSANKVIGVSIIGQDVTEQKLMMRKAALLDGGVKGGEGEAEKLSYKKIIDKATLPIWGVDREGVIVEWNSAMAKTSGISKEQALGKQLMGDLVGSEKVLMVPDKEMLLSLDFALQRALAGHETPLTHLKFVNDEGRHIESLVNMTTRRDEAGNAVGVLCFMQDVSMRKAVEKANAVRLAAEAAADAKSRHLAFLCHEIRNPLNGILGNITFMEDTTLTEEQRELVETTATCGHQLRKIVEDVLDISKIEEGKTQLELKELKLQKILNAIISQVAIAATKKGLQLFSTVEPRCLHWRPLGDAPRLQQVLSNFAWNTIKFTHTGYVDIRIAMQEPSAPDSRGRTFAKFLFKVTDSGEGISEPLRRRLFEEYSTGNKTSTSQYGGTGLGLSIVKQLAYLMGGEVKCQSQPGKGSTFSLDVDLQVLPAGTKEPSPFSHLLDEPTASDSLENSSIEDEEFAFPLPSKADNEQGAGEPPSMPSDAPSLQAGKAQPASEEDEDSGPDQIRTAQQQEPAAVSPSPALAGLLEAKQHLGRRRSLNAMMLDVLLGPEAGRPEPAAHHRAPPPFFSKQPASVVPVLGAWQQAGRLGSSPPQAVDQPPPASSADNRQVPPQPPAAAQPAERPAEPPMSHHQPRPLDAEPPPSPWRKLELAAKPQPARAMAQNVGASVPPPELDQVVQRLALAYGDSWSVRVVREIVKPGEAAVLAEITVGAAARQQWGTAKEAAAAAAASSGQGGGDSGAALLPAATARALANAALLFLPSGGLLAAEAVHQPAAVSSHWRSVAAQEMAESGAAAVQGREAQASSTHVSPVRRAFGRSGSSPALAVYNIPDLAQPSTPIARLSPRAPVERTASQQGASEREPASSRQPLDVGAVVGASLHHSGPAHAALLTAAAAKTSSGGQLAADVGLRPLAAKLSTQGPMLATADAVLDAPPMTSGLGQLAPPLARSSSGGSSVFFPAPRLPSSSPPPQRPQLIRKLPYDMSVLPSVPPSSCASPRHAAGTNAGSESGISSASTIAQSPGSGPSGTRGLKALVIDDEPVNVMVVKRALYKANFEVETGADGTDVIWRVIELGEKFDALLLDERLKVMNGSEACQLVRRHEVDCNLPEVPIIGISANVEGADLKKYAMSGYSAVMGKPINVRTAGERLRKYLMTYKSPSPERRAELKQGDILKAKKQLDGFVVFV